MGLNSFQINDGAIVEEVELASDSTTLSAGPFTITSVVSSTKTITLSGTELSTERISNGDILIITGGSAAGTYSINTVVDDTRLTVNETIPDAGSGTANLYYPSGASKVGFKNSTNGFDSNKVQSAIEEIDFRQIQKEPTGFVDRAESTISFNNTNRTFTISPVSTSFKYYAKGHLYTKTSPETVAITDTEGEWYIYYNLGTLTASQTAWDFGQGKVFVALIYWDSTNKKQIYFGDERHGLTMDWATHERLHKGGGMVVAPYRFVAGNYLLNKDGSLNSHAQFSLTDGLILDEDLLFNVVNSATPTNPFEQKLSTILWAPVYYQSGTTGVWRKNNATAFPFIYETGSRGKYNYYNTSTGQWSLELVSNDYYFTTWVLATNNIYEPIIAICGQNQYIDPLKADAEEQYSSLNLTGLPFQEIALLYRCMWRTSNSFTNTPKTILNNLIGPSVPSNLAQAISNKKLDSQTEFQTGSSSYVPITSFNIVPESGTYALWYNARVMLTANNSIAYTSFFTDNIEMSDSARPVQGVGSNFVSGVTLIDAAAFNGTQTLSVRVKVTSGTFYTYDRTLVLIRLGPA